MSILIKGLNMPRHGMVINIYADGRVSNHFDEFCETIATAVPVPAHGRLADLDKIENEIAQLSPEGYTAGGIRLILDCAPIIIEEER